MTQFRMENSVTYKKHAASEAWLTAENNAAEKDRSARVKRGFEQPEWYLRQRSFNIRLRAEVVQEFLRGAEFGNILDIGCGDGSLSVPLLTARNHLTLVDMSKAMLEIASSRVPVEYSAQVKIVNESFDQASLAPASYDLIIGVGVLAYLQDTRAFVERIALLLKPGGRVITECTDSSHLVNCLGRGFGRVRNLLRSSKVPLILHTSKEVEGAFKRLGFEPCGSFRYSLPPPGVRRVLNQAALYKMVRTFHGNATHNRAPWMGDECLYYFKQSKAGT